MQCRIKHRICHSFWCSLRIHQNEAKKTHFLAHFWRFFVYSLLRPMSQASIFCQIEGLMKIHNRGKLHGYRVSSCQVINFQIFWYQFSIYKTILFGGFFGPNSPKYCPILMKFSPEVLFKERKSVNLRIFKKFKFLRKREIPNFTVLVQLWPLTHALPPGFLHEDGRNRIK